MFGFGIGKLILLVLVILGVWYGFKLIGRVRWSSARSARPMFLRAPPRIAARKGVLIDPITAREYVPPHL